MSKKEINLSEKANSKKAKKNSKSKKVTEGIGTKEVAQHLEISPFTLRQILRSEGFFPDGEYTRYNFKSLKDPVIKKVQGVIDERKASKAKPKKKTKKATKAKSKKVAKKKTTKNKTKKQKAQDKVRRAVKTATHRPVK